MASTPNSTTEFDACPDGKMSPPSNTACASEVTRGPSRPVDSLITPTLRLSNPSATPTVTAGSQLRRRQHSHPITGSTARIAGPR